MHDSEYGIELIFWNAFSCDPSYTCVTVLTLCSLVLPMFSRKLDSGQMPVSEEFIHVCEQLATISAEWYRVKCYANMPWYAILSFLDVHVPVRQKPPHTSPTLYAARHADQDAHLVYFHSRYALMHNIFYRWWCVSIMEQQEVHVRVTKHTHKKLTVTATLLWDGTIVCRLQ